MDVSTAFLYGELDEEFYIDPPEGFEGKVNKNQVLKLDKALYGLKQATRKWNETLVKFFKEHKFERLKTDNCVFQNDHLIIAVYVDDLAIFGKDESKIEDFKRNIYLRFKTNVLGPLRNILGITVENVNDGRLLINQKTYYTA